MAAKTKTHRPAIATGMLSGSSAAFPITAVSAPVTPKGSSKMSITGVAINPSMIKAKYRRQKPA